ncbi:vWA domain-containing protein [Rhodococcus daqingensis]|uniref:VWA domain-containing protein n=1 Tax=Rhodococcus daqingensis TaxID=2479363 RepID=A0ABW2RXM4_9NOCA
MGEPALARGIDLAAFSIALTMRLRAARIPVTEGGAAEFARALSALRPTSMSRLYWAARLTLVRRQTDLAGFDRVFLGVFGASLLAMDPNARRAPRDSHPDAPVAAFASRSGVESVEPHGVGLPWSTMPAVRVARERDDEGPSLPLRLPGRLEALEGRPFGQFREDELRALRSWLDRASVTWPQRRTRRRRRHPTGRRIALRETIARSRRTGWETLTIVRTRPVIRPRRMVMLCDVSQSMQPYSDVYLHLMRAAVTRGDAEVFAFSTRLTRLTAVLAHRSAEAAIAHANDKVVDRFGGTHIGGSVRALLASHHGSAVRGAVVLIASDGWDSDSPEELGAAMARLHRRAYRVVWLNPRAGATGFEPLVGAMAAALPYCDRFLAADTLIAVREALAVLGTAAWVGR